MLTSIYSLSDPITMQVRYVGKSNDPYKRYNAHIYRAKQNGKKTKVYSWIRGLLNKDLKPILHIIETVPLCQWQNREKYWIYHYRDTVCNLTDGGDGGGGGNKWTEEMKAARSAAMIGDNNHFFGKNHSIETKNMLSEINKGKPNPFKGRKHSESTKEHLRHIKLTKPSKVCEDRSVYISKGGSKTFRITSSDGIVYNVHGNIKDFCKIHDLDYRFLISNTDKGVITSTSSERPYRIKNHQTRSNCLGWSITFVGRGHPKHKL